MKKITETLFSMQTMGTLILLFAFAIGTATFIENDFGAVAAKAVVYNATWFNILLLLLGINLCGKIIKDKLYRLKKFPVFLFHFAFLVILLGSAITRFVSYEGVMHIREGMMENTILSDNTFVDIEATDGDKTKMVSTKVLISSLTPGAYGESFEINDKEYKLESVKYIPNAGETIVETSGAGDPYIAFVFSDDKGRSTISLKYNDHVLLGGTKVNFADDFVEDAINIRLVDGKPELFISDFTTTLSMMTSTNDTLELNTWKPFEARNLYKIGDANIVLTNYYQNAEIEFVPYTGKGSMMNALVVEVSNGDNVKTVALRGGKGYKGQTNSFEFNGTLFNMTYGSKDIILPFAIQLLDFQLERYPGSNSPSSYASEVRVIDKINNDQFNYRIFMNNVLNYGGYRFFQSSYDADEKGTILSVNHDYWGTLFSYLGYFLMSLGMLLAIFYKNTRFAYLGKVIKKSVTDGNAIKVIALIIGLSAITQMSAQNLNKEVSEIPQISKDLAVSFGDIIVQSHDGRLEPMNTLSSELLRKISRKSKFEGLNADQVILGMMAYPTDWQRVKMIKVGHDEVKELIGVNGKYASYLDFINLSQGTYKLSKVVTEAYEKKPAQRSKFDNELIKVDERLNVCYMVFSSDLIKMLPDPTDIDEPWYSPVSKIKNIPQEDSLFITSIMPAILDAVAQGNDKLAVQLMNGVKDYQEKYSGSILPSESRVKYEIMYNKMQIFNNLSRLYAILGVIMIILLFVEMFKKSKVLSWIINFLIGIVIIGFILQTGGLALRWYISGHAPWSDGYESMIYIAWVTLLAGLIFAKGSKMTIAATTFLSAVILMVAHLSWLDPEVTNLVPVLKSYWLTIHVSVITASYGFLALSTLLGFMNLVLMILKTAKNRIKMDLKIEELTAISERSIVIGLYLLTIGTFLGGVWANESWGRYWGWDPKETWALVSILVYSFIAHMHYMPGMKSKFSFNFAALISYSVILMTYFGVNYYLSGLHSYAAGDPVPVPNFVYYAIAIVFITSIWAYIKDRKFQLK